MLRTTRATGQTRTAALPRSWRDRAACRDTDPELFFPTATSGPAHDRQVTKAKKVCARCPVRTACRTWALDALPHGVAGGLSEAERAAVRTGKGARR